MARGSINIIELHIEKVILGLAAAAMLAMLVMFMVLSPHQVEYNGEQVGPSELNQAILRNAESLDSRIRNAKVEVPPVPRYRERIKQQHEAGIFGRIKEDAPPLPRSLPLASSFGPGIPTVQEEDELGNIDLVTPLPPERPVVVSGRSLVYPKTPPLTGVRVPGQPGPDEDEGDEAAKGEPVEMPWVTVAAWYSVQAQEDEMTKAGYAAYRSKVYFVGADVERQEVLADGTYSSWRPVEPEAAMPELDIPDPIFDDETGTEINKEDVDTAFDFVKEAQQELPQPAFFETVTGDFWDVPPLPGLDVSSDEGAEEEEDGIERVRCSPEERREQRRQANDKLEEAGRELFNKNYARVAQLANDVLNLECAAVSQKRRAQLMADKVERIRNRPEGPIRVDFVTHPEDEGRIAVWVHDDTVESGKTYRYRMRVKVWNRYVGKMNLLKDPEEAKQSVLVGEWSLPSAPITVTPSTHFFIRSQRIGRQAASIDVWKWRKGSWLRGTFDVEVGDVIGGIKRVKTPEIGPDGRRISEEIDFTTGAVVLDLRLNEPVMIRQRTGARGEFKLDDKTSLVLVYLDPADGQVKERIALEDKYDPMYEQLKDQEP